MSNGTPGPRNAQDRLRRLLVMLPWLMEAGEVPLADVADRFGLTEAQVTKDLELVAMCVLPPYVDEMIDVFVDDGKGFVGVPRQFTRPMTRSRQRCVSAQFVQPRPNANLALSGSWSATTTVRSRSPFPPRTSMRSDPG